MLKKKSEKSSELSTQSAVLAYLIADEPGTMQWLAEIGLILVDGSGAWRLSPRGEAAMARLHERCQRPLHAAQWLH